MNKQLVLSALGADQPGLVNKISQHILTLGLNIEDSRMSVLGGEFAYMLLVSGKEATLQQLADSIPELEKNFSDLIFSSKFTQPRQHQPSLSYTANVHALDHQGIIHNLAQFFSDRNINIENLNTSSYAAPHTGSKMFSVDLKLSIPESISINQLREAFIEHCDSLNLDASFEPESRN
jgi:glycine cleavage system transcriptional repressor